MVSRTAPALAAAKFVASLVAASLLAASPLAAQAGPESLQSADRVDWWPKVEAIEPMLAKQKWKPARKQAARIAHFVVTEAWYSRNLDQVLGELALQQAIAEINLGREHEARWHWYTALNLTPSVARRDLSAYGRGPELLAIQPRRLEQIPAPFEHMSDLDALHLEPPIFPEIAAPDIISNTAAAARRRPDVVVEAILDKSGDLHAPVVRSEAPSPIFVYVAIEWLGTMPRAQPARLDGQPVDSLQELIVSFKLERTGGQIFLPQPQDQDSRNRALVFQDPVFRNPASPTPLFQDPVI